MTDHPAPSEAQAREQLATVIQDMRGSSWKGAVFCRACKVDGDAGLSDEAFVALAHRMLCPVRLIAERVQARAELAAIKAALVEDGECMLCDWSPAGTHEPDCLLAAPATSDQEDGQ